MVKVCDTTVKAIAVYCAVLTFLYGNDQQEGGESNGAVLETRRSTCWDHTLTRFPAEKGLSARETSGCCQTASSETNKSHYITLLNKRRRGKTIWEQALLSERSSGGRRPTKEFSLWRASAQQLCTGRGRQKRLRIKTTAFGERSLSNVTHSSTLT